MFIKFTRFLTESFIKLLPKPLIFPRVPSSRIKKSHQRQRGNAKTIISKLYVACNLGMLSAREFQLNYNLQAVCCSQRWYKQRNQVKLQVEFSRPKSISDDHHSYKQACSRKSPGNRPLSSFTPSRYRSIVLSPSSYKYAAEIREEKLPREISVEGAAEVPVKCLLVFWGLLTAATMAAPTTIAPYYELTLCGALTVSFVWFLLRWGKRIPAQSIAYRERVFPLYVFLWFVLFASGFLALAKAFGVIVAAIGGNVFLFVLLAVLANTPPLGDTINEESVGIGLTTTESPNTEVPPVLVTTVGVQSGDSDKILTISDQIKTMLRSHDNVSQGKEVPYCYPSHTESSFAELIIGYNLKHMSKDKQYEAQQDILLKAVEIINKHDAKITSAVGKIRTSTNVTSKD